MYSMECTQRLECTQELYESKTEKICPEQIGFLGICGVKHPVKKGPNKIGRDPQTCSIVLNLNSISRQHAVINVLNHTEFMLMDLDSANKTKLMDKTLQAYIPHPLKNGDMVQFGDIFGVFRLLQENDDLPMTQAIDLPETPVATRHMSVLHRPPVTTIPESPDVSDREESFIAPSQPKGEKCFRNSNSNHFIKPAAKVISIQPIGSHKIDNVYWNSSKRSVSLNTQFNDSSLNDSTLSDKNNDRKSNNASIFEMETQPPLADANDSVDSIYTANTQVPNAPSIHTENTQLPTATSIHTADTEVPTSPIHTADTQIPAPSPSIHSLDTQLPASIHNLPEVCKIDNQQEMQFDLCSSNKKANNIFEANTQLLMTQKDESVKTPLKKSLGQIAAQVNKNLNVSDEVILFDDIDGQQFEDDFASQPLLPPENILDLNNDIENVPIQSNNELNKNKKSVKKDVIIHSDSSTDCEDIDMLPTQKITITKVDDDEDLTDCEDLFSEMPKNNEKPTKDVAKNVDFEDMLTQVIDHNVIENNLTNIPVNAVNLEDMPTQVIVSENYDQCKEISLKTPNINNLEDIPTQIIVADDGIIVAEKQNDISFEDLPTQVISDLPETTSSTKEKPVQNQIIQDFVSPFKVPLMSPIKVKRKDIKIVTPKSKLILNTSSPLVIPEDDDNYYAATQDILDDLCTQRATSPDINDANKDESLKDNIQKPKKVDDDFLPSSVEEYEAGKRSPHIDNMSLMNKQLIANKSSESSDGEEKVNNFVSRLSSQEIRDMVGVEPQVANLKRGLSDTSDLELTPKKVRPAFMDIDLPSSQEIKTSVSVYNKTVLTESSSESEVENDSEECTPILYHKKKKAKVDAKVDLTKVFEAEALPSRVITRIRKPTAKLQNSDNVNKLSKNILKPKYLTEQEDEIDNEIITENITRLKSKSERSRNKDVKEDGKKSEKVKCEKENKIVSKKVNDKIKTESDNNSISENIDIKRIPKHNNVTVEVSKTDKRKDKSRNTNKKVEVDANKEDKITSNDESKSINNKELMVNKEIANVTVETSTMRSTRSTRNRRKAVATDDVAIVAVVEKNDSQNENQRKTIRRNRDKKPVQIDLTEEVVEVRRSGRQKPHREKKEKSKEKIEKSTDKIEKCLEKTVKSSHKSVKSSSEKIEKSSEKVEKSSEKIKKPAPRRGRPPKHEQSTVYSLSSDSGTDSPRNPKRSATANLDPPSPKRTRLVANTIHLNSSLRSTPARLNKNHFVLFTAFPCEEVKAKLEKLGAVVVSDVKQCTVVLTMQVKRTFKLLCAVGLGRPIVGPGWVQACVDTNMIVDPWLYILKDEAAEKRFQFNLERTLTGKRNFLKGYNVSATPNVMPSAPEMKLIVESSGGVWGEGGASWVCVSCAADRAQWAALARRGAALVATEFILGGVLRQRADTARNALL